MEYHFKIETQKQESFKELLMNEHDWIALDSLVTSTHYFVS